MQPERARKRGGPKYQSRAQGKKERRPKEGKDLFHPRKGSSIHFAKRIQQRGTSGKLDLVHEEKKKGIDPQKEEEKKGLLHQRKRPVM